MHFHNRVSTPTTKTLDLAMLEYCWDSQTQHEFLLVSSVQLQPATYSNEVVGMMYLRSLLYYTS
ncbi:hypothetical protein C1H46_015517 [Malus baccata]|uniref:Uncharacterized protein n=1 Tax=Malus baccata TaxID=106549 RepID=A0A540MJD1_MALBA|nr:hypothetical protein C1H46_015517 [Malus baccata]